MFVFMHEMDMHVYGYVIWQLAIVKGSYQRLSPYMCYYIIFFN